MKRQSDTVYECGHIQNVMVRVLNSLYWFHVDCLPEMKKDVTYKVILAISKKSYDIEIAKCSCKTWKGPKTSCKHVGTLCYALVEFCTSGRLPDFLTCTQKLQEWTRPRKKKVDIIPVLDLSLCTDKIKKKSLWFLSYSFTV
uniref:SWIM-type domain-containing protein n=1 Tax=Amphimedon queenslandica TaxID=400682 RepID=A0A1X7UCV5_AMPQE